MKEFVFLVPKNVREHKKLDASILDCLDGYLLTPSFRYVKEASKQSSIVGFCVSSEDFESEDVFFDGEAVYDGELLLGSPEKKIRNNLNVLKGEARGSYAVVSLANHGIQAFHDQLGNYPLYYLDDDRFSGVTNNLVLLESFLKKVFGHELCRHSDNLINEVVLSTPMDIGSYGNTYFVPFDHEIKIDGAGKISLKERKGADYFFNSSVPREELVSLCVKDIRENVKAVALSNIPMKISDVTGGMDSRMVLAAIIGSGYKEHFFFNTNGKYPNPDANVSNYLMKKYGLKKVKIKDGEVTEGSRNFTDRFHDFAYMTAGIKNNLDREPIVSIKNNKIIKMGGGNSEFYKGFYSKHLGNEESLSSVVDFMSFMPSCISKEVVESKKSMLHSIFGRWQDQGQSLKDVADRFYVEYRGRYHNGTCEHWSRAAVTKCHPLYSANTIRLAFSQPAEDRVSGKIAFELMNALYPPIVFEPFEKRVWAEEAIKGVRAESELKKVNPVTLKSKNLCAHEPVVHYFRVYNRNGFSENINNYDSESAFDRQAISESRWCKHQKKLGRKWHWFTLDQVQKKLKELVEVYDFQQSPFLKEEVEKIARKDLYSFVSINEVLEVHQLCLHFIFLCHQEKARSIKLGESVLEFEKIK